MAQQASSTIKSYSQNLPEQASIGLVLSALKACRNARDLAGGKRIHANLAARGDDAANIFVANTLVDMYAKCGSMADAFDVFKRMNFRSVVSWNCIILGYAQSGQGEIALQLYAAMEDDGCIPNRVTILAVLKACARLAEAGDARVKLQCLERGRALHSQADHSDLVLVTSLIDLYTKCGEIGEARALFDGMKHRDLVSWNSVIMGYAICGGGKQALELYARLRAEGFHPDSVTFVAALKACCSLAEEEEVMKMAEGISKAISIIKEGRLIHMQASQSGDERDLYVATSLVDMYAKCGCLDEAKVVFQRLKNPSVVSWTAMILGFAQRGEGESALSYFSSMKDPRTGVRPDAFTYVAALKACGSLGDVERGREIQGEICSAGLQADVFVANSLVDFFGECGSMDEAEQVFDSIASKNLVSWSALIAGYSCQGKVGRVLELFQRMQEEQPGLQADEVMFRSILTACSHAGVIEQGKECFSQMVNRYGIQPEIHHYNCMIDLLARGNRMEEAVAMVASMPFEATRVTWTTVLAACCKWKNVGVAEVVFEKLLKVDDTHAGAYVLMANIYGNAGMWDEQNKVMIAMSKKEMLLE